MIAFVLPAKNEELSIGQLIVQLQKICKNQNWAHQIIIADDSSDGTAQVAKSLGAEVVQGGGVGLGQAIIRGLSRALSYKPEWIVTLDSDGQVDLEELPAFFSFAKNKNAEVVISSRFLAPSFDYQYPWVNFLGNRILVAILRLATGRRFTDSHGGIRLMKPSAVRGLFLLGRHTYVQETLIQMHRRKIRIVEMPSRWKERSHNESRVLSSIFKYVRRTLPALLYWLHMPRWGLMLSALLFWWNTPTSQVMAWGLAIFSLALFLLPLRALRVVEEPSLT